jgi:hypothetical protein
MNVTLPIMMFELIVMSSDWSEPLVMIRPGVKLFGPALWPKVTLKGCTKSQFGPIIQHET